MQEVISNIIPNEKESKGGATKEHFTLHVTDLTFVPSRSIFKKATEYLRTHLNAIQFGWVLPSFKTVKNDEHWDAPIHRVQFSAMSGEVTAILGNKHERRELVHLLSGRRRTGAFDGDIQLNGPGINKDTYYYDKIAFVQSVSECPYK
jgi:hypothetical protein